MASKNDFSQRVQKCAQNPQTTSQKTSLKIPPHLFPNDISVFGYGVTSKPFVEFINSFGKSCKIYDDKFAKNPKSSHDKTSDLRGDFGEDLGKKCEQRDKNGNILLPPSAFKASKSSLEFISPGILPTHTYFSLAKNPIGEYDFVWELMSANDIRLKSIWISGTNGKTTTTQMLTHLLESFGALSGGNIGTPLTTLARQYANDFGDFGGAKAQGFSDFGDFIAPLWVLESSSFAMHYAHIATPQIYLLLPLSQDHISWHNGFEGYVEDKLRVLNRMDKDCFALLPNELKSHKIVQEYVARNGNGSAIFYADSSSLAKFCGVEQKSLPFAEPFLLDSLVALSGAILAQKMGLLDSSVNIKSSAKTNAVFSPKSSADLSDLGAKSSLKSSPKSNPKSSKSNTDFLAYFLGRLDSFHIGAHRIEEFYEPYSDFGGNDFSGDCHADSPKWLWIDDSKGTNTDATLQAFKRYKGRRIYAILGGDDKGADILPIFSLLANGFGATNAKDSFVKLFAIGSNEAKILSLAKKYHIFALACENLKNAVISIKRERKKDLQDLLKSTLKSSDTNPKPSPKAKSTKNLKQDFITSFVGLLSPAAASLDQFSSYKQRGELFKKYALES